ncbi:hypothetical protein Sango_1366700 [Sesamum angolense]|uniref:Bifunctional inhibitor/plant lipid transfer protein/seed storage helical domain-containing protein n=1 Tax=Sesamum angolense TaxID=2727404 RepID=A0AAE2BV34_9LAMI|nr:hypothetical protein Sango_1366700 [Sesamum angolense]
MSVKVVYCLACVMALLVSALAESHANDVSCSQAVALLTPYLAHLMGQAMGTSRVSAISCLNAITRLMPCESYLLGFSSSVSVQCCQGAESLNQLAGSDRGQLKPLCQCLKQAAVSLGVNVDKAKQLPQLCKITVPVPIDPNVNCDRLKT